ncbi:hypothetical protein Tco_0825901 [Tanacetum coccineum]
MYRPPSEPSRQEEFKNIIMNFIFDQEERITQLEDYMQVIAEEFMEFSSDFTRRLKKKIKENKNKPRKIKKITKYPDTKVLENSAKHDFLKNLEKKTFPTSTNLLCVLLSHSSTSSTPIPSLDYNGSTFLQINEPIFRELVREFFASFEFDATSCRYEPLHKGVTFRLGGVEREMSLLELGWRVGLYSEGESRDVATLSGLRRAETVNSTRLTHLFWPSIGDGGFNVGNTKAKSIRNPRMKLAHHCITMTISGRKETTNCVTEIDLFYLYCIFGEEVICNIPYWLAKYLKSIRNKSVIFGGMFVTRIARSFGLLTNEMVSVLNCEPPPHVYRKTSLVNMGVIIELHEGECCWPATREVMEEGEGDDKEGDEKGGNEGVGGSTDIYHNMSRGDWQVRQER